MRYGGLYPSKNATEVDRYVSYNPVENYWTFGTTIFTTWEDKEVFQKENNKLKLFPFEFEAHYTIEGYHKVANSIHEIVSIK